MYIATKYIGMKYTPGEILPDNLPADQVKWLLEAGAIRKTAPVSVSMFAPVEDADATEAHATGDDAREPDAESDAEGGDEGGDEPEDEADDEAEAPEIDVMEGITSASSDAPEPKPVRKRSRGKEKSR